MSHDITIRENGFAEAAYSMKPAWHGLGEVYDHAMTSQEALTGAGLDWKVIQKEVAIYPIEENPTPVEGYRLNIREDTKEVLGQVTDQYKPVQNIEAFEFLDELIDEGEMMYESAFSMRGGKQVVLLAQMPGSFEVSQDDHLLNFIMLSSSHTGKQALQFGPTSIRVVCANTFNMAMNAQGSKVKGLTINHNGDIKSKLAEARKLLQGAQDTLEQYNASAVELAQTTLSKDQWKKYLDILCPELDPLDPNYTSRRADKVSETRLAIKACYKNDRQQSAPNTAWAAFNAFTEHVDHLPRKGQGRRQAETRFNVTLCGIGKDMKQRAYELACNMAEIKAAV